MRSNTRQAERTRMRFVAAHDIASNAHPRVLIVFHTYHESQNNCAKTARSQTTRHADTLDKPRASSPRHPPPKPGPPRRKPMKQTSGLIFVVAVIMSILMALADAFSIVDPTTTA